MRYIATLVSNPARPAVDDAALALAEAALGAPATRRVLSEGVAADLAFDAPEADGMAERLLSALGDRPIDIALQPADERSKKLFLADMDSTMIAEECIDELGAAIGLGEKIAAITEQAMRGELDFEAALSERVALLEGLNEGALEEVYETRINLNPGAATLIATLNAHGVKTVLVSGGFTFFTGRIAKRLGFTEHHANTLEIEGGRLTGRVIPPILGREAKLERLRDISGALGLSQHETMTVGDGANDAAMTEAAGLGVAYRAKPALDAVAHARVRHGDLTALLYFLGIEEAAFSAV